MIFYIYHSTSKSTTASFWGSVGWGCISCGYKSTMSRSQQSTLVFEALSRDQRWLKLSKIYLSIAPIYHLNSSK